VTDARPASRGAGVVRPGVAGADGADGAAAAAADGPLALTGAAHPLVAALARRLAAGGRTVLALDERDPAEDVGAARRVRVDLRGPSLGRVLDREGVTCLLDATALPGGAAPRAREPGPPVGAAVLAAAQRTPSVRRVVLVSTTGVYGAGPRAPSVRTEDAEPPAPRSGPERAAAEAEAALRGLARRRPDVATAVLRLADLVGPGLPTPLGDWLELPAVPVVVGHDPRLQVLHADDALEALALAATGTVTGVVNVAGEGVVTLQQAAALCGRVVVPVPGRLVVATARGLAGAPGGPGAVTAPWGDVERVLRAGRVVDTRRMREDLGLHPRRTSREAVEDLARGRGLVGPLSPGVRAAAVAPLAALAGAARGALRRAAADGTAEPGDAP